MDEALALSGRVAIVTGAGHGLGRAEALALARAGARLVLNDVPSDAIEAVAAEIAAAGGHSVVAAGDVGEWATGERLVGAALPCDLTAAVQIARWVYQQTEKANGQVWVVEKVLRHLSSAWTKCLSA